jgi:hypothetical protein
MVCLEVRNMQSHRRVELESLTLEGRQQIEYECDQLKEKLEDMDQAERDTEELE